MLLVAGEDLIAASELQASDRHRDALGGAGRDRDVGGLAAERRGVGSAELLGELLAPGEVRLRASLLDLPLEHLGRRASRPCGERPVGARVQVRQPIQNGKLGSQASGVHSQRE